MSGCSLLLDLEISPGSGERAALKSRMKESIYE